MNESCAAMGRATTSAHNQVRQTNRCVDPEQEFTNSNCQRAWKPERAAESTESKSKREWVWFVGGQWAHLWNASASKRDQRERESKRERWHSCVCLFMWNIRAHAKEYVDRNFKLASHRSVCSLALFRTLDRSIVFLLQLLLFILVIYYSFMKFFFMNFGAAC